MSTLEPRLQSEVVKNPADVIACGAPIDVKLCDMCIDAYRNGIEPGESACEDRAHA